MATTAVVPFMDAPVPAHIVAAQTDLKNIPDKVNIPQLSFRGKVWRQVIDGEEKPLVNKEDEPVSTVHVVVLNHNKARSRAYYEGAFEEGKSQPPACWSMDGETPDDSVKEPQASSCAKCPNSVKGSKITPAGKETTACSVFKRLVIVPLTNLESTAMLLRLAQTSMWDKNNDENEAKGYYAWDQYLDMLRARGATHTGLVATKVRFDSRVAYPKLLFAASRWLEDEEIADVKPRFESEDVLKLLNASEVTAAARKPKADADDDEPTPPPAKKKAAPVEDEEAAPPPKKKAAPAEVEETDDAPPPTKKKAAPPPPAEDEEEAAPPPPKKKAAAPPPDDDEETAPPPAKKKAAPPPEDEEEAAPPPKAKKKAAPVEDEEPAPAPAAKKKGGKDNGLGDLVEEWDN